MIRYPITKRELEKRIRARKPNWLEAADKRTKQLKAGKKYSDSTLARWSEVKPVFMELQYNKCAYCERKLSDVEVGTAEHDVEHFRPKNTVKSWPTKQIKTTRGLAYEFETGAPLSKGYYLLAHNIQNYATACKPCNSKLKGSYFPIEGKRASVTTDVTKYKSEKALLIYPIGSSDQDPEKVIEFVGLLPRPVVASGRKFRRARVTIDFFRLADREDLRLDRAEAINHFWTASFALASPDPDAQGDARATMERLQKKHSRHSSCVRSFAKLLKSDPVTANLVAKEISEYLNSTQS